MFVFLVSVYIVIEVNFAAEVFTISLLLYIAHFVFVTKN
jgi:hypothetical protein